MKNPFQLREEVCKTYIAKQITFVYEEIKHLKAKTCTKVSFIFS